MSDRERDLYDGDHEERMQDSTLKALLRDRPKRGRPRRAISRQSVYVALQPSQKQLIRALSARLPAGLSKADIPDLAIALLNVRLEELRRAVADRNREVPEGFTDLSAYYLLWDLPLPTAEEAKWTSIRLSPQMGIQFGRAQGTFKALFGSTRSEVFSLALALLAQFIEERPLVEGQTLPQMTQWLTSLYL